MIPATACILIGGDSNRFGSPKWRRNGQTMTNNAQTITNNGQTKVKQSPTMVKQLINV